MLTYIMEELQFQMSIWWLYIS